MIDSSDITIMQHLKDIVASSSKHSRCFCCFML